MDYYLDELAELSDEVNSKLATYQSYNYNDYLKQEHRVQIDVKLAKYLTNKETQASAPKDLVIKLLNDSGLVNQSKYTKEHRNILISELKKALNYQYKKNDIDKNEDNQPEDFSEIYVPDWFIFSNQKIKVV